MGNFRM